MARKGEIELDGIMDEQMNCVIGHTESNHHRAANKTTSHSVNQDLDRGPRWISAFSL